MGMWEDICAIFFASMYPSGGRGGGGGGGGLRSVTSFCLQLFSIEILFPSKVFFVTVGPLSTRIQFMLTPSNNTQVKFF